MIKECLSAIVDSQLDLGDRRKKAVKLYMERYDEDMLGYILGTPNGLVADDIFIHFYNGIGFRCSNDETRTGRLPMCNIFQKMLNSKYEELAKN